MMAHSFFNPNECGLLELHTDMFKYFPEDWLFSAGTSALRAAGLGPADLG